MEPAVLDATRAAIRRDGAASLTVNDLTPADLGRIAWSGGPRALYDRLGYKPCGHTQDSWPEADDQGNVFTYCAELTLMRKRLRAS